MAQLLPWTTTPPAQPGPVETDAVAQDLGAGELRDRLPLGERGRRLFEVDPIDLDPAAARLHERAGLSRESRHICGGELDVVEEHGPGDVAELVRPDHRARRGLREQSERRSRLAPRQRRHPHVEPDGGEGGADDGHELPRLVLAQRHLSATARSGPVEGGEEPVEARPLAGHGPAAAVGPQRGVDRDELALADGRVDRHEPHATGARRVELHDEPRT